MKTHAEVHEMTETELLVFAEENGVQLEGMTFTDLEDAAGWVCAKLDIAANGDDDEDEDDDDEEEEKKKEKEEEEDENDDHDGATLRCAPGLFESGVMSAPRPPASSAPDLRWCPLRRP